MNSIMHSHQAPIATQESHGRSPSDALHLNKFVSSWPLPVMTPGAFSQAIGLEETVFRAQFERGYWGAPIRIGKRVFVNVEALRIKCAERALEFAL